MTMDLAREFRLGAVLAVLASAGCSGGSAGGGDGDGGGIGAFNFNQANMEYAAGIGARVVDAFPPISDVKCPSGAWRVPIMARTVGAAVCQAFRSHARGAPRAHRAAQVHSLT